MKTVTFTILLLAVGCTQQSAPTGTLSRERFKTVLLEAQLIEARVNQDLVLGPQRAGYSDSLYATMFSEQGVTKEAFTATFDHYTAHPQELKTVYEEILTELSTRKDRPTP